eukprot:659968-Amphidinium_carterae.2
MPPPPPIPRGTASLALHTIPSIPSVPGIKPRAEDQIIRTRPTMAPRYQAQGAVTEGRTIRQGVVLTPAPAPQLVNLI